MIISRISMTIIKDIDNVPHQKTFFTISTETTVMQIDIIVAIRESTVADIIETKVSSMIFFSIRFALSLFPINIVANPNRIVKIREKTVVNVSATVSCKLIRRAKIKIADKIIGKSKKHNKSQKEIFLLLSFIKT